MGTGKSRQNIFKNLLDITGVHKREKNYWATLQEKKKKRKPREVSLTLMDAFFQKTLSILVEAAGRLRSWVELLSVSGGQKKTI